MSVIAFEKFALGLQADRATTLQAPTYYINFSGSLTPQAPTQSSPVSDGTLAARARSNTPRKWSEWEGSGDLDMTDMLLWASMGVQAGVTPSTPGGATNSRLWTFTRSMATNALKAATMWAGDPNVLIFRSDLCILKEFTVEADGSGTSNVSVNASGVGKFPVSSGTPTAITKANPAVVTSPGHGLMNGDEVTFRGVTGMTQLNGNSYTVTNVTADTFELATTDSSAFTLFTYSDNAYWVLDPPTYPAQSLGDVVSPLDIQVWIDSSSNIGTTQVEGKVVKVSHTIPSGLQEKFLPTGPGGGRTYSRIDPGKVEPSMTLAMEVDDPIHYNMFREGRLVKVRTRYNGGVIETVSGVTFRYYLQIDMIGKLEDLSLDENEGVNRLFAFSLMGQKHSELGNSDVKMYVQTNVASLS